MVILNASGSWSATSHDHVIKDFYGYCLGETSDIIFKSLDEIVRNDINKKLVEDIANAL